MLPLREDYVVLKQKPLRLLRAVLKNPKEKLLDEIILALADYPVDMITRESKELLRENIRYWLKGYAVPFTVLKEVGFKEPEKKAQLLLRGEDIAVEPDVNYEFASDFTSRIKAEKILDIASGFGWVPPLLSKKAKVLALDKAYLNRVIYQEDRIYIDGTTIELFPDSRAAREYIKKERKLRDYRDFALLFWNSRKACMDNITLLQGDATDLRSCQNLNKQEGFPIDDESFEAATCFFAFNHIPNWRGALKETYRVLMEGGEAWTTLYREHLERFPVKFAYNWTEHLKTKIVKIEEFTMQAEKAGFRVKPIKKYRGASLYYLLRLRK
jgi:SAM-dependent methyltransferase